MWSNKPRLKLGNILGYLARLIFPNQSNPFGQYDKSLRLNLNSRLRAYINCNRGRNMIFYIISTDKYPCIFFSVRWKLLLTYCKFKIMCPVVQSNFVLCSLFFVCIVEQTLRSQDNYLSSEHLYSVNNDHDEQFMLG